MVSTWIQLCCSCNCLTFFWNILEYWTYAGKLWVLNWVYSEPYWHHNYWDCASCCGINFIIIYLWATLDLQNLFRVDDVDHDTHVHCFGENWLFWNFFLLTDFFWCILNWASVSCLLFNLGLTSCVFVNDNNDCVYPQFI